MPAKRAPPKPEPLQNTLPRLEAAFKHYTRLAIEYGAHPSDQAKARATKAKEGLQSALEALRASERLAGRLGSINWIGASMGQMRHSAAVRAGAASAEELQASLDEALQKLREAVW